MLSAKQGHEVVFILPGGSMTVRLMEHTSNSICAAVKACGARFFVTQDGFDHAANLPIWGVFDAQRIEKLMGEWVLPVPIRLFTTETSDAAAMFAATRMGR